MRHNMAKRTRRKLLSILYDRFHYRMRNNGWPCLLWYTPKPFESPANLYQREIAGNCRSNKRRLTGRTSAETFEPDLRSDFRVRDLRFPVPAVRGVGRNRRARQFPIQLRHIPDHILYAV